MSGITPKPVLTYASPGSGGHPVAILTDKFGVVQVSTPQLITTEPGAGLTLNVEAQAFLVNVLEPFFSFTSTKPPGLLTASTTFIQGFASSDLIAASGVDSTVDGWTGSSVGVDPGDGSSMLTLDQLYAWNGASYDRVRIASVFKTVVATAAGNTAVWTPTAGKKFRLMGYTISAAGTLAATGVNTIQLRDSATVIKTHFANMIQTPSASVSGGDTQIGADLGQGQLSALANNVLSINLGTAMATGGIAVNVWGTEE